MHAPTPTAGAFSRSTAKKIEAVRVAVAREGGIARSAELERSGIGHRAVAEAVACGVLRRVRRVWVATGDADPQLVDAARRGAVLTCVTQAARLGLWIAPDPGLHIATSPHAGRADVHLATAHRARPIVARHPSFLVDPIENMLAIVAACQPREQALATWESALHHGLFDRATLARLPFRGVARELAVEASPFADSGLETYIPVRLRWLRLPIRRQVWLLGHRVDFLIGDRLVLQIDGGHHVGAQRAADVAHDAALLLRGYHVIRVGYWAVVDDWPRVQDTIMRAVAEGLHLAA